MIEQFRIKHATVNVYLPDEGYTGDVLFLFGIRMTVINAKDMELIMK